MKVLFDTSVLVAAFVESHPAHSYAFKWLQKARTKQIEFLISSHTIAELYAVLTVLPVTPTITPGIVIRLIKENVLTAARVITLDHKDYRTVITGLAGLGITGGTVYDGLIARAAKKAGADKLLTLNQRDFKRVAPDLSPIICSVRF